MIYLAPFWPSLAGGALIGLSAALLLLTDGRVAGISGIAGGLLGRVNTDTGWRMAFLIGLLCGPIVFLKATGHAPALRIPASPAVLSLAGLLVGFGTRLGSGCTSGHGVSGLARFSPRSMAAVATFMATAMITVFVVRHSGLVP
jgi:uncharacterized membrane protein YedE/YeeE